MKEIKELFELKARLAGELMRHVGRENAIGMGELYEAVFDKPWSNRINDTRALRRLITDFRDRENQPICSVTDSQGGGYYIASVGSEQKDYIARQKRRGLKILYRVAKLERKTLPGLLGQMILNLQAKGDEHGANKG